MIPFKLYTETPWEQWRAGWFWGKEPEMIAWIDEIPKGAWLWDVGANIGVYSLYAWIQGIKVEAFEADIVNYVRLENNIRINGANVRAHHVCLGEESGKVVFFGAAEAGASGGDIESIVDMEEGSRYGSPDYLKIDVDGEELKVLRGMDLSQCQAVMVEVTRNWFEVIRLLKAWGFREKPLTCGRGLNQLWVRR
jgi:FkbM family methyltransferase